MTLEGLQEKLETLSKERDRIKTAQAQTVRAIQTLQNDANDLRRELLSLDSEILTLQHEIRRRDIKPV